MTNADKAVATFKEGFSCSQVVLAAYAEKYGLDREMALKISTGFGGGMHLGQTCGAVTGAIMVIGLKHGRCKAEDRDAKTRTYEYVEKFAEKFRQRHGSIVCRDLIGCDISTAEGMAEAKQKNVFRTLCVDFAADAAKILDEIL